MLGTYAESVQQFNIRKNYYQHKTRPLIGVKNYLKIWSLKCTLKFRKLEFYVI